MKRVIGRAWAEDREYSCSRCKKVKPAAEFSRKHRPTGVVAQSDCKSCSNIRLAEWRSSRQAKRVPDWRYDYRFARDILGYGQEKAAEWVMRGYGMEREEVVLRGSQVDWQPDPYIEEKAS